MSARRRTEGERHARRVLCALARTALDVCDLRAEAGLEDDDRPRMWLCALERWARGEEPPARLGARSRDFVAWREKSGGTSWTWALFCLVDAVEDFRRHPSHVWKSGHVVSSLAKSVPGEDAAAALVRAERIYRKHLADVEREDAEAALALARSRAREDKHAAELVLGTVRP